MRKATARIHSLTLKRLLIEMLLTLSINADKATKRQPIKTIQSLPPPDAKHSRRETKPKLLYPQTGLFGGDKVPKLVEQDKNRNTDNDNNGGKHMYKKCSAG